MRNRNSLGGLRKRKALRGSKRRLSGFHVGRDLGTESVKQGGLESREVFGRNCCFCARLPRSDSTLVPQDLEQARATAEK